MPSIRLTPLQPTTFDMWRDRVLTVPRSTLIQEAAVARDASTGSFQTLTRRLVGDDPTQTLAGQLESLITTLTMLLTDSRSGRSVTVAESAADLNLALSDQGSLSTAIQGPLSTAIQGCATAITGLAADDDDGDEDSGPSDAGIPDENGLIVLSAVDVLRRLLLDTSMKNGALNKAMDKWRHQESSGTTGEVLRHMEADWLDRFIALGNPLPVNGPGLLSEERRERLGQLIAFEYDVTLAFHDAEPDPGTSAGTAD